MKVSIFGSCRQDSLYEFFDVTKIKNELTYPHYSSEVLQAVKFCDPREYSTAVTEDLSRIAFRTPILNRFQPACRDEFFYDFVTSDLYVVEIASRISYRFNDVFLHHIITEPTHNHGVNLPVYITDESDDTIYNNVVELKRILKNKFFIVTHFYTKTNGKRYELVLLLKKIAAELGIPLFDPVIELEQFGVSEIFLKEEVLSHYTEFGHQCAGNAYRDFIVNVMGIDLPI